MAGTVTVRICKLIYSAHLKVQVAVSDYFHVKGEGNAESIDASVSDAIVRNWLRLTGLVAAH